MKLMTVLALIAASAFAASVPNARTPVLLELFTSEGCSSCPPADALLRKLDKEQPIPGADLIVLSEHVDYWNNGGWNDPYSQALFSERQQRYATELGADDVYTPQVVVDGRWGVVGGSLPQISSAVGRALSQQKTGLKVEAAKNGSNVLVSVKLDGQPSRRLTLYCVLAAESTESSVRRGENRGRELTHTAVAYSVTALGSTKERTAWSSIPLPLKATFPTTTGTRVIVFLQDASNGHILGASQSRL